VFKLDGMSVNRADGAEFRHRVDLSSVRIASPRTTVAAMARIAVLGMGAMGSRMAANLIADGDDVSVWNRDQNKTEPLIRAGARAARTPAEAAADAQFVIVCVRDDDASRSIWLDPESGILTTISRSAVAIESSTLTVDWVKQLAGECDEKGVQLLDAPVAGSRPQAEARRLIYLVGGDVGALRRAYPILKRLGGAIHHAGGSGSGAAVKLMVNALFGIQVAAVAELIGFARNLNLDVEQAMRILGSTPVSSPAARMSATAMLEANYLPLFPIDMVEKDFGYLTTSAASVGADVPISTATHERFTKAREGGLADLNITGLVQLYE
jgi:3-hydroxyisobutyrate dehydrogenase